MSVVWSIRYDGQTKTLAAWGLGSLTRLRRSQEQDIVTCLADGALFDGAPLFAYGATVEILKGTTPWFVGRVIQVPREGTPKAESILYKFAGPWWHLDNLIYQQQWMLWDAGEEEATPQYKGRVILGQSVLGTRLTAAQQLQEVLQFAQAAGAPLAIGTIEPSIQFPWDEAVDITCGEAIRRVLRWCPDAITWFDYSTNPPTFNCARRSSLTPVSTSVNAGAPNERIAITSREDLRIPAVILKYEQTHQVNDLSYQSVTLDRFPVDATGREFGAVVMTIQLAGSRIMQESQEIKVEAIPLDLEDAAAIPWWKRKLVWLNDPSIDPDTIVVTAAGRSATEGMHDYPNELIEGTVHSWMPGGAEKDTIWAYISYTLTQKDETGNEVCQVVNRYVVYNCVTTELNPTDDTPDPNVKKGTYKHTVESSSGEAIPVGLAQALYNSVNPLQFDGQFVTVAEDVYGKPDMGNLLNLTDGRPEWANMRALVVSIEENVDTGRSTATFGPPRYLGPADLIELLRANRGRATSMRWKARETGDSLDAESTLEEDGIIPDTSVADGEREPLTQIYRKVNVSEGSNFIAGIKLDPADISKTDAAVEIKARELFMLDSAASSLKKRQVLASDSYGDEKLTQITVVTDVQYDTSSHKLQKKTRTIRAIDVGTESGWTDITGGQAAACPST
jgi:hypothetical protein